MPPKRRVALVLWAGVYVLAHSYDPDLIFRAGSRSGGPGRTQDLAASSPTRMNDSGQTCPHRANVAVANCLWRCPSGLQTTRAAGQKDSPSSCPRPNSEWGGGGVPPSRNDETLISGRPLLIFCCNGRGLSRHGASCSRRDTSGYDVYMALGAPSCGWCRVGGAVTRNSSFKSDQGEAVGLSVASSIFRGVASHASRRH